MSKARYSGVSLLGLSLVLAGCGAPQSANLTAPQAYTPTTLNTAQGDVEVVRSPNGTLIGGGDIALGDDPSGAFDAYFHNAFPAASGLTTQGHGAPSGTRLWAGNVIPYIINPNLDPKYLPLIDQAVQEYATRTNVRLVKRTSEKLYVEVAGANDPSFCGLASSIGQVSTNTISSADRTTYGLSRRSTHFIILNNTDPACSNDARTVIHEFGHILGLRHEHSRPDRDSYIRIDLTALDGDPLYVNAYSYKYGTDGRRNAYDLSSVMHYNAIFRKNGKQVIYPLDTTYPVENVGGRTLSSVDVQMVNTLYPTAPR